MLTMASAYLTVDWSIPIGVPVGLDASTLTEVTTSGCIDAANCNPTVGTDSPVLGAIKVDFTGITDAYAGQIEVAGLDGCYIQDCALLSYPGDYVQCETIAPEDARFGAIHNWAGIDTEGYITHLMFRTNAEIPGYCDAGTMWPPSWPDVAPPCPMEGERVVRVTCVDKAGNIASQLQDSINLDMIDPTQSISYAGGTTTSTTHTISTTEADWGVSPSGVAADCKVAVDEKIDGGSYDGWTEVAACTDTCADCVYTFPAECKWYKFRYRARDAASRPLDEWAYAHDPGTEVWHDKTAPSTLTVGGAPGSWQNIDATATIGSCTDNCGCDTGTYAFKVYAQENEPVCSTTYADYSVGASMPITAHAWVCAAAKDDAGNTKYSSPVEFKIDKTDPTAPSIIEVSYDATGLPTFDWGVSTDYGDQGGIGEAAGLAQYQLQVARDTGWVTDPVGTDNDGVDQYVSAPTSIYDTNNYATHDCPVGMYGGPSGMIGVVLCQGKWVWRVRAQDTAGNWGNWATSTT